MNFLTAVTTGLTLFQMLGGGGSKSGYGEDPNFTGGGGGSAQTGSGFLDLIRGGAKAYSSLTKDDQNFQQADTSMFQDRRSVKEIVRGGPAVGGLSSSQQQLFQQAAVMQALQHYQQNGSRDVNMQSMLNEAGIVSPTSRQGIKTLATRSPDLKSEINVG